MPRIFEDIIVKSVWPIVFVIEASDNMAGERMALLKDVMEECHDLLLDAAGNNPDFKLKIAAIKYGDSAKLLTDGYVSISQLDWTDITDIDVCGEANLGKAIELLDTELQRRKIIEDTNMYRFTIPTVVFFASSSSADDYLTALSNAGKNRLFRLARKVCVAIGDEADKDMLAKIAGNIEAVIGPDMVEALKHVFWPVFVKTGRLPEEEIVKVDGIEIRGNFCMEGAYGFSVDIADSIDVVRCQCGPCKPETANDVMFCIDDAEEYLKLRNSENVDDLYVSFYVGARDERTIVGCNNSTFEIRSVSGNKLDSPVIFEIEENGIKISNRSSGSVYLRAFIGAGMCTHLLENDIIQNTNETLFTIRSSIESIAGELGGWHSEDDFEWQ